MLPDQPEQTVTKKTPEDNSIDYSELYRTQELKQLNKRLKRNQFILQLCSLVFIVGALIFWAMPLSNFKFFNLMLYFSLAFVIFILSLISIKKPYFSILSSLVICIGFSAAEIILLNIDEILIESSIQKLFILSLLISRLHSSKEAELIRKELHFS